MDRAPGADQPELVDPERTDRNAGHQGDPDGADRPMRKGPLGGRELHHPQHEGRHRRDGVQRDRRRRIKQRRKIDGGRVDGSRAHGDEADSNKADRDKAHDQGL
jgi:hypothetical protein